MKDRWAADRMFATVVRLGGFSAAAERLRVSPGQASKMVSRLETHLGVRLLNRTTRAVALTAEGEAYFTRITGILDDLDDLDDSLRDAGTTPRGMIRLTAPLTFGTAQLCPALADFSRTFPEISLDVEFTDRLLGLAENGLDAAIRVGTPADSSLRARKLGEMHNLLVAAPAYLAAHGTPLSPADLVQHDAIIDTNFARPDTWDFREEGVQVSVPVTGRLRFANAEACLIAAEAGLGIANIPAFIAARSVRLGRLRELLPGCRGETYGVHGLTPAGRHMPARVDALLGFLAARWGRGHDWAD